MPRATLLKLIGVMVVLTVVGSVILLIPEWNGLNGSVEADKIDTLLDVMIVLSMFVFAVVMVMLGYSVWKYRAKPGDESDGQPVHGNTKLEVAWTLIPTIIVLFGAAYSWAILDDIEARSPDRLQVDVTGQQFKWTFEYPEEGVRSNELVVPLDRQVNFNLTGIDVIHSFWVPEWRMKKDAVPGLVTSVAATPDTEGTFSLVCTEFCGTGHATMRAFVRVVPEQEYEEWIADQDPIPKGEEGLPVVESEFNEPAGTTNEPVDD